MKAGMGAEIESYITTDVRVVREVKVGPRVQRSAIENLADEGSSGYAAWWQSFLRGGEIVFDDDVNPHPVIRTVDAFCGCGGLTLGA